MTGKKEHLMVIHDLRSVDRGYRSIQVVVQNLTHANLSITGPTKVEDWIEGETPSDRLNQQDTKVWGAKTDNRRGEARLQVRLTGYGEGTLAAWNNADGDPECTTNDGQANFTFEVHLRPGEETNHAVYDVMIVPKRSKY